MKLLWFTNTPSMATERLTGTYNIGGGWLESLEKHFRKETDIEVAVAFYWDGTQVLDKFIEEGRQYYAIPAPFAGSKLQKYKRRSQNLIEPPEIVNYFEEIVADFQPDMIHVFGTEKAFGLIAPKVDVPTAIWIQGNLTVYTHKWFAGISRSEVLKLTPHKDKLKHTDNEAKYQTSLKVAEREQEIFKGCKYFTGRTDWDRRITKVLSPDAQYFPCDEILRDSFYESHWKPHTDRQELRLMTTIQGNLYKGFETILESMPLLREQLGNNVRWRICGLKENDALVKLFEKKYKVRAASLNIELLGRVSSETLIEELMEADVFVHPSHIDNSPNSVCEAMLVGTPVVATYAGGTPSLLENNQEGILVQAGDPYALAGAILDMYQNPEIAVQMADAAKKRAQYRQDPKRIVDSLLAIYQNILAHKNQDQKISSLTS